MLGTFAVAFHSLSGSPSAEPTADTYTRADGTPESLEEEERQGYDSGSFGGGYGDAGHNSDAPAQGDGNAPSPLSSQPPELLTQGDTPRPGNGPVTQQRGSSPAHSGSVDHPGPQQHQPASAEQPNAPQNPPPSDPDPDPDPGSGSGSGSGGDTGGDSRTGLVSGTIDSVDGVVGGLTGTIGGLLGG